jgi:hypothetical protein
MKLSVAFLNIAIITQLNFTSASSKQGHEFVIPEQRLDDMLDDPPSFSSSRETGIGSLSESSVDIISLGSITRMDYLTAQISTWASHRMVRHFWGLSEVQDYDPQCGEMSVHEIHSIVEKCKAQNHSELSKMSTFLAEFYGVSEGNRVRSNDPGWICALRRVGRAFGWLHSVYLNSKDSSLPDYLLMVDDDTYVDMEKVKSNLDKSKEWALSGCVFEENDV